LAVCSRIMARPKKDEDPGSRSVSWRRRRKERAWGRDDNEEEAATVKEGRGGLRAAGAGDRMGSQPTSMGSAGARDAGGGPPYVWGGPSPRVEEEAGRRRLAVWVCCCVVLCWLLLLFVMVFFSRLPDSFRFGCVCVCGGWVVGSSCLLTQLVLVVGWEILDCGEWARGPPSRWA
jgi:hypothetical protein